MANFRRREVLRFAAMTGVTVWTGSFARAASDFWNKQKPADWTEQEKEEIRTKSPWAKKVDAEMAGGGGARGGDGGGDSSGSGDDSGGGGGGGKRGGGGGGGGGGSKGGNLAPPGNVGGGQALSLEMLWMSARPIQDAHPLTLGAKLQSHYVIAVTGIPQKILNAGIKAGSPAESTDPTAALKRAATLVARGKDPRTSDVVMSMNNNATLLFGFSRDSLPLTVADKDVEFELKLGTMTAKAKFALKDMVYSGELAL